MNELDVSARWQARHPRRGGVDNRHLCADIVPERRALTSSNATFGRDDGSCAARVYERQLHDSLARLHGEQRYRVFTDIRRISGRFPGIKWRKSDGDVTEITVWCSNDYFSMGQHPQVAGALAPTADRCGAERVKRATSPEAGETLGSGPGASTVSPDLQHEDAENLFVVATSIPAMRAAIRQAR